MLRELLLEPMCPTEQEVSGEHLDGETEKTLKPMAAQLRGELRHFIRANSFSKSQGERKSSRGAQLVKAGESSQVELKEASVQTMALEGDTLRFPHEDKREACGEKPTDAMVGTEHQLESLHSVLGRQAAALPFPTGADRVSISVYYRFTYFVQTKLRQSPLFP